MTIQAMAGRFERAVVTQQPMAIAGAVDHDFLKLFALTRDQDPGDTPDQPLAIPDQLSHLSAPDYPELRRLGKAGRQPARGQRAAGGDPSRLPAARRVYPRAGAGGGHDSRPSRNLRPRRPRREHTALASACLPTTTMAAAILIVSDAYEFSWRYQLPALVLLPPAGGWRRRYHRQGQIWIVSWRGMRTIPGRRPIRNR